MFEGAWGDSMPGVLEDLTTIRSTLGDMTDDELQAFAEGALTIGDLWGPGADEISRTVKTMVGNFDDLSKSQALDLITTGFQNGGDFSGELLDTLNEYAPAFSNMGLSADQALGVLLAGAEEGAFNLDKVGDAMKEFEIRAQDGSESTQAAFDALNLSADEMTQAIAAGGPEGQAAFSTILAALSQIEDPVARNMQGVALFGTQWEDLGDSVVLAMAEGVQGVGDFEGATQRAGDAAYSNLSTTFESLKRQAMGAFIGVMTPAVLTMSSALQNQVIPTIQGLVGFIANNKAVFIGMAAAIVGLLVPAFLAWAGAAAGAAVSSAAAGAAMALALAPVIAPILAVVAAAGLLGLAWKTNFLGIQDITDDVLGYIVPLIEGAWQAIQTATEQVVGLVKDLLDGDWSGAWSRASGWVDAARQAIVTALPLVWDAIKGFVTDTIPKMAGELASWGHEMVAWVGPQIPPLLQELGRLYLRLAEWIYLEALPDLIMQLGKWGYEFVAWVGPQIPGLLLELGKLLVSVNTWIFTTALPELVSKLATWGAAFIGWVAKDAVPFIVVELWKLHGKISTWIVDEALPAIVSSLVTWGSAFFGWVAKDAIPFIGAKLGNLLTTIKDWITDEGAPGLLSAAVDLGDAIVDGLWNGISASTEWLVGKLTAWVEDAIPGPVRKALEILSPSRVMARIGHDAAIGLVPGMLSALPAVEAAAGQVGAAIGGAAAAAAAAGSASSGGSLGGMPPSMGIGSAASIGATNISPIVELPVGIGSGGGFADIFQSIQAAMGGDSEHAHIFNVNVRVGERQLEDIVIDIVNDYITKSY